jgi:hypothetical protein
MRLPKIKLTMKQKVKFGRARAVIWLVIGAISFLFGWESSVVLVWIASFYANAESGFATGEAADDTLVMRELKELRKSIDELAELKEMQRIVDELKEFRTLVEKLAIQQNGRHSKE